MSGSGTDICVQGTGGHNFQVYLERATEGERSRFGQIITAAVREGLIVRVNWRHRDCYPTVYTFNVPFGGVLDNKLAMCGMDEPQLCAALTAWFRGRLESSE